jgi:hypothetical protein
MKLTFKKKFRPRMLRGIVLISVVSAIFYNMAYAQEKVYSDLWGEDGELWNKKGRLPDFSFAGYHDGSKSIPNNLSTKNIKTDYGAKGDGITDDSEAFLAAINENSGVFFIPEGKYSITKILKQNFKFQRNPRGYNLTKENPIPCNLFME